MYWIFLFHQILHRVWGGKVWRRVILLMELKDCTIANFTCQYTYYLLSTSLMCCVLIPFQPYFYFFISLPLFLCFPQTWSFPIEYWTGSQLCLRARKGERNFPFFSLITPSSTLWLLWSPKSWSLKIHKSSYKLDLQLRCNYEQPTAP